MPRIKTPTRFRINTKSDVEMHNSGMGGKQYPAINVKVYNQEYDTDDIAEKFNCSNEIAEQAGRFLWESAVQQFWENAQEYADETFDYKVKVYSAGRSGGWLIVDGLDDIEQWEGKALAKWRKFNRIIGLEVQHLSSKEYAYDMIESNRWAEPEAEQYNFIDKTNGDSVCIVDVRAVEKKAREDYLATG